MQDLLLRVQKLQDTCKGLEGQKTALESQLASSQTDMQKLEDEKAHLLKSVAVLDQLIQTIAASGIGKVEGIVTQGLQLVFGDSASCAIEKKEGARGFTYKINIKFNDIVGDPIEDFGGGPVNVTAFLLRVLMLHRFERAKLLVLDETFANVSRSYLPQVSALLKTLTEEFGFTILTVTHQPELACHADMAYEVGGVIGSPTLKQLTVGDL